MQATIRLLTGWSDHRRFLQQSNRAHRRRHDSTPVALELHLQAEIDRETLEEASAGGAAREPCRRPLREVPAAAHAHVAALVDDDEFVEGVLRADVNLLELFEGSEVDGVAPISRQPGIERCGPARPIKLAARLLESRADDRIPR